MELRHLRYFVAVAEEGHFGRAARRLHISQPALSQQILALEEEVGTALLERRPKQVVATAAGEVLLRHAREILAQAERALEEAREAALGPVGTLRVGLPETRDAIGHATRLLGELGRRYPRIRIEATGLPWLEQPRAIVERRLDLGFCWAPAAARRAERRPEGTAGLRLFDDPTGYALLSAGHALAGRELVTVEDLRGYRVGLFERALHPPLHDAIAHALRSAGLGPVLGVPGVASISASVPLILALHGWTLVPRSLGKDPPAGTIALEIADVKVATDLELVWRRGDRRRIVRTTIELAQELSG